MAKMSSALLKWRRKQPRGAIMSPATFHQIEKTSGIKRAGAAYWKAAKAKFKSRKK